MMIEDFPPEIMAALIGFMGCVIGFVLGIVSCILGIVANEFGRKRWLETFHQPGT